MDKSNKTILIIAGVIIFLYILMSWLAPKPLDWTPSYNTKDKIPMGMYVLNREIDSFFNTYVERSKVSVNEYFYEGVFEDSILYDYNLLYINKYLKWNPEEITKVCRFVREGNSAFISTIQMPEDLQDSLKIDVTGIDYFPQSMMFSETMTVSLADTCLEMAKVTHHKGVSGSYFAAYDTAHTKVLGHVEKMDKTFTNFIAMRYGMGMFYVHLEPAVFTNYFLLEGEHHHYGETVLSYIPSHQDVIWSLNNQTSKVISDSPYRFILSQPALKWAWYLLIAGTLLFVVFNIRRSQRAIKSIHIPVNTSVEFARTIGNMYYQEGDIRNVMHNKIIFLMERIRSEYHISTEKTDEKFIHILHLRSGKDQKIIEKMMFLVNKHLDTDYTCTVDDLSRLNTAIENFYK